MPPLVTSLLRDGRFQSGDLPLSDRGFRYGMSVFETIAILRGRPRLLDAHLARLAETVAAAGFLPPDWQPAARAALNTPPIAEGVARIYVTAGDHDGAPSRVALLFEALTLPGEFTTAHGVPVPFVPATPFGKTGNYWPHLLAQPANGDQAILHRPDGTLLGGATANLLLFLDGRWLTPAHPTRRGVVCDWVSPMPADLTLADLATAEEICLTNSRVGIVGLSAISHDGPYRSHKSHRSYTTYQSQALWLRYRAEVLDV